MNRPKQIEEFDEWQWLHRTALSVDGRLHYSMKADDYMAMQDHVEAQRRQIERLKRKIRRLEGRGE